MKNDVASSLPRTSPGSIRHSQSLGGGGGGWGCCWQQWLCLGSLRFWLLSPEQRKPLWRLCESLLVSFLAGDSGVEMAWGFLFLFCFLWNQALDKHTWTLGLWGLHHHAL